MVIGSPHLGAKRQPACSCMHDGRSTALGGRALAEGAGCLLGQEPVAQHASSVDPGLRNTYGNAWYGVLQPLILILEAVR